MRKLICDFCGKEITGSKVTVTVEPDNLVLGECFDEEELHFHIACATRLNNKFSKFVEDCANERM